MPFTLNVDITELLQRPTGVQNYIRDTLEELPELAPELTCQLLLSGSSCALSALPAALPGATLHCQGLPRLLRPRYLWSQLAWRYRQPPATAFWGPAFLVPSGSSRIPRVVTCYDLSPLSGGGLNKRLWARLAVASLRQAEAVHTISQTMKGEIQERYAIPAERIFVGEPRAARLFSATPGPDDAATLERYGLQPQGYFLSVGTNIPRKNYARLLAAPRPAGAALVLVGHGVGREPTSESVHLLEDVPSAALPTLYRSARALIFPSLYEGFGIPIREAFACGCQVLCSEIPVFREAAGEGALYFDPRNPDSLAAAMARIWESDALRQSMKRNAEAHRAGISGARALLEALAWVQKGKPPSP